MCIYAVGYYEAINIGFLAAAEKQALGRSHMNGWFIMGCHLLQAYSLIFSGYIDSQGGSSSEAQ